MTVEQVITPKHVAVAEGLNRTILPGDRVETELPAIEKDHPHTPFSTTVTALCAPDDSCGIVMYFDPEEGPKTETFKGSSKLSYIIETPSGIGIVEWKHIPKR